MVFKKKIFSAVAVVVLLALSGPVSEPLFANTVATLPEEHDHIHEMIYHTDEQISSMTRLKNYYMAKSVRYRNRATRIRYQDREEADSESEKLVKQANEYDKIVDRLNREIAKLESQKRKLEKKL